MSTEHTPGETPASQPQDEPHPQANPSAPGSGAPGHPAPTRGGDFFGWVRGLGAVRGGDRWVGGVASGIAHRWGVDPVLVRGLFIVAAIFLGVGVLAYGILWLLLPEPDGRIHLQEASHGRWSAGMTGGLIVTVLGLGGARAGFWFGERGVGGAFWGLFWVAVVAFGIYSLVRGSRRRAVYRPTAPQSGQYPSGQYPSGQYPGQPGSVPPHAPQPGYAPLPFDAGAPATGGASYAKPTSAPSYGVAPTSGPYSPPPYYGGSVPPAVRAQPRPPRRRGPSAPFVLVVLGVAALVAGSLGALIAMGAMSLGAGAIWTAVAIVLGLGILVSGLRGRTAGMLTLFAVIALVSGTVSQTVDRFANTQTHVVSESPSTLQQAVSGYDITAARGTLNLSALDSAGPLASETVIPIKTTMSQVTITVPKDVPVQVRSSTTLAEVKASGQNTAGFSRHETTTYNSNKPGASLVVQLDATLSEITVTEER
ncbi:hypothetical protein GCM10027449_23080 [Sinomonas notoginsengisoli]|uniref:PspC domain-containing protein n=1 Tax=Sinomonas notoginsengisoli TaxID=1457311 RepID=UPI001F472597|nr:PspC domain-containing protein [Sinomonas notoginsengisoli]